MTDDDQTAADLRERVDELESQLSEQEAQLEEQQETIRAMLPSRRDLLKAAGGGAAGVGLGALLTGSASAGNQSVGTIGTQSSPIDVFAEDIYDHNGNNPMSFPGDGSVNIDDVKINNYVDRASLTGSNQTINSGVSTTVQLDTVDDSELGGWDLANNQWVAPSDGKYLIAASVSWADANSTGEFQVFIQINGSPAPFQGKIPLSSGESEYQFKPVSAYNLTSNDSVELVVFHNSGSNENINAAADNTTLQILNGA